MNVLGNQKQSLTASKNDAMESEDFDIFAENIEVWKNIVSKTKKSCNTDQIMISSSRQDFIVVTIRKE